MIGVYVMISFNGRLKTMSSKEIMMRTLLFTGSNVNKYTPILKCSSSNAQTHKLPSVEIQSQPCRIPLRRSNEKKLLSRKKYENPSRAILSNRIGCVIFLRYFRTLHSLNS